MQQSLRCGARVRSGEACRAPAIRGRTRCRMHGGAPRSGAPRGNRNAQKHGLFSQEGVAEHRAIRTLLGEAQELLDEIKSGPFRSNLDH
ncbi:HGGxSTG domain-containing protein [Bradyrhizobium sp. A5]|uniref:HGGxSTG domain-containing protein n=1 Tax=Bradyrhizobium sp. A5 TaxID=3133696 RepID=UPI0032545A8A